MRVRRIFNKKTFNNVRRFASTAPLSSSGLWSVNIPLMKPEHTCIHQTALTYYSDSSTGRGDSTLDCIFAAAVAYRDGYAGQYVASSIERYTIKERLDRTSQTCVSFHISPGALFCCKLSSPMVH